MTNVFSEISPWQLFLLGGPVMWPILLCSVFALAIIIEKFHYFFSIGVNIPDLKEQIFSALQKNDIKEALACCESRVSPLSNVLKAGLLKHGMPKEEVVEAMQEASQFEIPRLEKRMLALSTIANVSTLLGLLGTVTGMCGAFHTIQVRAAAMNPVTPGDIAGGIWESLITTVAGLIVAIPVFVAYNYFVTRVNRYVVLMEMLAVDLANFMTHLSFGSSSKKG